MKSTCALLLALLIFGSVSQAQNVPARTDLYHVHFAKAALGKGAELGEFLKTADPNVPMSAAEFTKALGIDEGSAGKTAGSVYVVSVYRTAPGHREQLEKALAQNGPGDSASGNVLMQHVEGGPWTYLTLVRYNSWQDFATSEKTAVADTLKAGGGWLGLREHSTYHNDTITDRIAP